MRGYKVMYDYRGKVAGMIMASLGFLLLVIQKLTHFTVFYKLNSEQHFSMLLWITIVGLFFMMFSYEKREDERVKLIRAKSVMIVSGFMISSTMAFALTVSIMPSMHPEDFKDWRVTPEDVIDIGRMIMFYPAVAIVVYLIIFHVGLYFDKVWDYSDNIGFWENIRKNKMYMIIIAVISIIIVELIFRFIL